MGALFNTEFVKLGFAGLLLHHIWKVFSHYFCRCPSAPFSPSGIPTIQILVCLKVSLGSRGLYSLFSHLFSFCSPDYLILIVLSSLLLIHSSALLNLLMNLDSVFFISFIVFKLQTFFLVSHIFNSINFIWFTHHFTVFAHVIF